MTKLSYANLSSNATDYTGQAINQTTQNIGDLVGPTALGSNNLIGLMVIGVFGVMLWRSEASTDAAAAVMIPAMFFLGNSGYLPFGSGIVYGMVVGVAALFAYGVMKYITT